MAFAPVPFAADDAAKRVVTATTGAKMDGADVAATFHTILRAGHKAGEGVYGDLMTTDGKAVGQISHNPDFTSLLPKGDKLYSVSHFEEAPSADNGGAAKAEWVDLGQADDASLKAVIDKGLKFSDIGPFPAK